MSNTLIMGAAIGYRESQISPFLRSLRRSGYTGDVMLLVSPALARRASADPLFMGVKLVTAPQWFPVRFRLASHRLLRTILWAPLRLLLWVGIRSLSWGPQEITLLARLRAFMGVRLYPPSETRYLYYLHYLEKSSHSRILICDTRDVIFQMNPFDCLPESGLAVSMELDQYTIGSEPYNAGWVRALYGSSVLNQVANNQVSCSGVTYGDRAAMLQYLRLMVREILGMRYESAASALGGGYDQGIHNVLLRTGQLGAFRMLRSLAGPVATVNGIEAESMAFDEKGHLLNRDGSVVAIVHQYDRAPGLSEKLLVAL